MQANSIVLIGLRAPEPALVHGDQLEQVVNLGGGQEVVHGVDVRAAVHGGERAPEDLALGELGALVEEGARAERQLGRGGFAAARELGIFGGLLAVGGAVKSGSA